MVCGSRAACLCRSQIYSYVDEDALFPVEGYDERGRDNLPDGICFFDEYGTVRMINRKMMSIGVMLFGKEIQTLDELHGALSHPSSAVECLDGEIALYRFPTERFTASRSP